jgi:predicted heme/steroid binding protein
MKKIWLSSTLCLLVVLMSGCSSSKAPVEKTTPVVSTQNTASTITKQDLTIDELKKYDGKNGNPAYVAIDGTIYDVTNVKEWKNGEHKNGLTAGNDLSKEINSSPHGKDVLKALPVVGRLK